MSGNGVRVNTWITTRIMTGGKMNERTLLGVLIVYYGEDLLVVRRRLSVVPTDTKSIRGGLGEEQVFG